MKQIFWKKTKMTKFDDFWKFSPKFTSAWKQKRAKWQLCFDPQIIVGNGQKNSKKFLVYVLDTPYMNCNKFYEKNQKWQNLTIFGNFHQNKKFWSWKIGFFDKNIFFEIFANLWETDKMKKNYKNKKFKHNKHQSIP